MHQIHFLFCCFYLLPSLSTDGRRNVFICLSFEKFKIQFISCQHDSDLPELANSEVNWELFIGFRTLDVDLEKRY